MGATYGGTVEVTNDVEVKNDQGNPVGVSGTVDLSDRIDRILGQVAVNNFPASQAVTGPFLTDGELRAAPVPVDTELGAAGPLSTEATLSAVNTKLGNPLAVTQSGTWTVTQSGTVAVDSELPTAAALSDALSRTASVPLVGAAMLVDDGTQFLARARAATSAGGTLGATGIPAAAISVWNSSGNYFPVASAGAQGDGSLLPNAPGVGLFLHNGATWDKLRSVGALGATNAGLLAATPVIWTGAAWNALSGATGDSGVSALYQTQVPHLLNSAGQVDRQRANVEGTALASAARTATTNGSDTTNYNGRGALVYLNVTAASGTGGLLLRVQGKDPVSGGYFSLTVAPTAVTATGLYVYELYPGATGGNATQTTGIALPRIWRVLVTHNDTSSYTYSVGYSIVL